MNIDLPNIDLIVSRNKLPEVSNPVYIEGNDTPTVDGLFSYDLFGMPGSSKRKFQFGYIDLPKHFLHPIAYIQLLRIFSKLPDIVSGRKKFSIGQDGSLYENEAGETGIDFLYKHFEKIKFDDRDVKIRKKRIDFFKSFSKNEIFCTKWLTIPPFYYDINLNTGDAARSIDELGALYVKLISYSRMLKSEGAFFTAYGTEMNIQQTLVDIYNFFLKKISKKTGLIHRDLLGKNIDYCVRGVLSCPSVKNSQTFRNLTVPYGKVGVPLYQLACLFFPFVINEMMRNLENLNAMTLFLDNGKGIPILDTTMDQISSTNLEKVIKLYARSPENRLQRFVVNEVDRHNVLEAYEKELKRDYTITDFLYSCVESVIKDKFVVMVRYPLEDYRNVGAMRPVIITTEKVIPKMNIFKREFINYPDLTTQPVKWIESIQPNATYLEGYGGDFDGDTVSLKGIFTQEANLELAEKTMLPLNFLDPSAGISRVLSKEALLSIYSLTK